MESLMPPLHLPSYDQHELDLDAMASWPASRHVFDAEQVEALRAAEAAGRPLLVRGEPGTGKSQLAHAAAFAARRQFLPFVVDARTEATDLMWRFDAVARLADAHLASVGGSQVAAGLDTASYVQPGPLWWAFDWNGAAAHAGRSRVKGAVPQPPPFEWTPGSGTVLLIDEIDKAEAEVPNGLLEALGNGRFAVPPLGEVVGMPEGIPRPLVVITTNDERELPAAFLRRCLVLTLTMPEGDALLGYLRQRGQLHFPRFAQAHADVLDEAARMLAADRLEARHRGIYQPGLAEYLDLLRALEGIGADPMPALARLRKFAFRKQPAG
jgi:MoxR-like ATPase